MTVFHLPDLGEGLTESEIVSWLVAEGDTVTLNQPLAEVETAKAVVEVPSPHAGTVMKLYAEAGDTVPVGAPLIEFDFDTADTRDAEPDPAPEPAEERVSVLVGSIKVGGARPKRTPRVWETTPYSREPAPTPVKATPPVRAYAKQRGVTLHEVTPQHGGTVTRSDIDAHLAHTPVDEVVPVSGLRKHTAAAMVRSFTDIPHASVTLEVDVTETRELLRHAKTGAGDDELPASFLGLVSRAVVRACQRVPEANARFNADEQTITRFGSVNLGIAIDTPRGLLVASVDDAQELSARHITQEIAQLKDAATRGDLPPEKLTSSTITVSNVGVFGVDTGVPIINPGQSLILALGAIRSRPWEHKGAIALRDVVALSVSFDHRLLDGAEASIFLTAVGEVLERPGLALLDSPG